MAFEEILDQAIAMLQRRGRLTYGTYGTRYAPAGRYCPPESKHYMG